MNDERNPNNTFVASYPLSDDQRDIWVLSQLNHQAAKAYSEVVFIKFHEGVSLERLRQALQVVGHRHQSLHAKVSEDGTYFLVDDDSCHLEYEDFSGLDVGVIEQWMHAMLHREFGMAAEHLTHISLAKISAQQYILAIVAHHIIMDGSSMNIFIHDLATAYHGLMDLQNYQLPRAMQFFELKLEQDEVSQVSLSESTAYWHQQLTLPLPILDLPTDNSRPSIKTYRGKHYYFVLDNLLRTNLKIVSAKNKATLFMVLFAAFNVLLRRYSHKTDVIVGVPCMKRQSAESYSTISHSTTILPIRTNSEDTTTFSEYLRIVRTALLMAMDHKFVPFNTLFKSLNLDWNMSRSSPVFDVVFNLDSVDEHPKFGDVQGAIISPYMPSEEGLGCVLETDTAKFDLFLNIVDTGDQLRAVFEYSTDLFLESSIMHIAQNFEILLQAVCRDPQQCLHQLPIVPSDLQSVMLSQWNATDAEFPAHLRLEQLFAKQVSEYPLNIALSGDFESLTYQELDNKAKKLAELLIKAGVRSGTSVVLMLDKCPEYIISLIATLKVGCVYVPVDPETPHERLMHILADLNYPIVVSRALVLQECSVSYITFPFHAMDLTLLTHELVGDATRFAAEVVYVIYTSGSTGYPKGVMVTHQGVSRVILNTTLIQITSHDVISLICDLSFDISMFEIWGALLTGARCVIFTKDDVLNFRQLKRKLNDHQVTIGTLTPVLFHTIVQVDPYLLASYQTLIIVGDILDPRRAQIFLTHCPQVCLINGYGPTEATIFATAYAVNNHQTEIESIPIGKPISNTTAYVLDQWLQPVPIGVVGELYLGGPGVALGYLNNDTLTSEKFILNPFNNHLDDKIYRTGDLVKYLPDGNLVFIGRIGTQIKIRGYRVELGEIDFFLKQHPLVKEAAAMLHHSHDEDRMVIAYVALNMGMTFESWLEVQKQMQYAERVREWQTAWDMTYRAPEFQQKSYQLNSAGWKNSYDGLLFSDEIMTEWADNTAKSILQLQPKRVLEIGCGTGLLLFRIAPACEAYVGLDMAPSVVSCLRQTIDDLNWNHVQLHVGAADQLKHLECAAFDVIIINSVIQYFPSETYLQTVFDAAVEKLCQGGKLFIGDVRALMYQYAFISEVLFANASDRDTLQTLQKRINDDVLHAKELLIDPYYFVHYAAQNTQIEGVQIDFKRLAHQTEMSRFRYDAIIYLKDDTKEKIKDRPILDWQKEGLSIDSMAQLLDGRYPVFSIKNIPNARVLSALHLDQTLGKAPPEMLIGEFKKNLYPSQPRGIDPLDLLAFDVHTSYDVHISFDPATLEGMVATFTAKQLNRPVVLYDATSSYANEYVNQPLLSACIKEIRDDIREHLKAHLPSYMLPTDIVLLSRLPLTNSGKLNRKLLTFYQVPHREEYSAPESILEKLLVETLEQLLNIQHIGIDDDFFDLGMDSLQVIRWVVVLHQHQISLHPQDVFMHSTVMKLAKRLHAQPSLEIQNLKDGVFEVPVPFARRFIKNEQQAAILITGVTGFLGLYILKELLVHTSAILYCLVRSTASYDALHERFLLSFPEFNLHQYEHRIIFVRGDIENTQLGLSPEIWEHLTAEVNAVYHCAANVRHIGRKEQFLKTNVEGTRQVIAFCQQGKKKYLHHMSTVAVMGVLQDKDIECQFFETSLDINQHFIYPYAESKYLAEQLVQAFAREGGEANIYRIGTIGADNTHGRFQKNIHENYLARLIHATINLKSAPKLSRYQQDYLPVNELAKAIIALSLNAVGETYHLYHDQTMSYERLCLILREMGYPIDLMEESTYRKHLSMLAGQSLHQDDVGCMLDFMIGVDLKFPILDCQATQQTLMTLGIFFTPFTASMIVGLMSYGMNMGYFSKPGIAASKLHNIKECYDEIT